MAEQQKGRRKNAKVLKPEDPIPYGMDVYDTKKKKWIFGKELGSGGCGVVYEGSDGSPSFDFVIKIEHHSSGGLYSELHVYHAIGKQEEINKFTKKKGINFLGIPEYCAIGSFDFNNKKYRFLVMQRYGMDLQHVLKENSDKLHPKTVFTVGISVIRTLEYIHSFGYVHLDIKAANLMLGRSSATINNVYLLDMGLATRYISKENVHKTDKPNPGRANNGTAEFLSRDGHLGVISRRSDLEILGYNMLFWLSGTLPWINCIQKPKELKEQKDRYMSDVPRLMKSLFPHSDYPELENFLVYVSKLGFEESPQYDMCVTMFRRALKSLGLKDDGVLILKTPGKVTQDLSGKSDSSNETSEDDSEDDDDGSSQDESTKHKSALGESVDKNIKDRSGCFKSRDGNTSATVPHYLSKKNDSSDIFESGCFVESESGEDDESQAECSDSESSDERTSAASIAETNKTAKTGAHAKLSGICSHLLVARQLRRQHSTLSDVQSSVKSCSSKGDQSKSSQDELTQIEREKLRSLQNIELSLHSIDVTLRKMLGLFENSQI